MDSNETTIEFTLHGHRVALYLPDPTDLIQQKILLRQGFYEPMLLESIRAHAKRDALCVDAGAHMGNHTVFMAKICGMRVLSFEPQPDVFRILERNIEINQLQDRVTASNVALGEVVGRASISRALADNTGSARLTLQEDGQVEITTLDEQVGDREVSVIKIDVEGFELEVLKGAARTIARDKPVIYAEAADGLSQKSLKEHLASYGYLAVDQFRGTPVLAFMHCASDEERLAAFTRRFALEQESLTARIEDRVRSGATPNTLLTGIKGSLDGLSRTLDQQIECQRAGFTADLELQNERISKLTRELRRLSSDTRDQAQILYELWNLGIQNHTLAAGPDRVLLSGAPHTYRPLNLDAGRLSDWQPTRASWTIPKGFESEPFMQGFTPQTSVHTGDELEFKLSTNRASFFAKIRVFRLGAFGRFGGKEVHSSPPICVPQTGIWERKIKGVDPDLWQTVYRVQVPDDWRPGCYMVRFEALDDKAFLHPFWVTSDRPTSRIAFVSSLFTHIAHNRWGSSSLHQLASRLPLQAMDRFRTVRIHRPYHGSRGGRVLLHEFPFLRWADANDLQLDCLTDIEVHQHPELLASYDHLVFAGDTSYCTPEVVDALARFSDAGGKLSAFGAAPGELAVSFDPGGGTMSVRTPSAAEQQEWRRRNAELWLTDEHWSRGAKPMDLRFSERIESSSLAESGVNGSSRFHGLCGDRLSSSTLGDEDAGLLARIHGSTLRGQKSCDTIFVETRHGGHVFVAGTDRWPWGLDDMFSRPDVKLSPLLGQLSAHILGAPLGTSRRYPLVTVIMTAYNSEEYIAGAIESVLSQSYANLELIVVDDNSTDGTYELLLRYAQRDSRVLPFKSFRNHGTYWSKNYGITKSRGQFITFQDSDDRSDPERLLVQLEPLLANRRAVASIADYERVTESGERLMNRGVWHRRAFPSLMIRSEVVLNKIGFFDSVRTSADQEYFHRLRLAFGAQEIVELKKPLYKALVREGSLTQSAGATVSLDGESISADDRLAHLSGPRKAYVLGYERWHQSIERGASAPYLAFPLSNRPFAAPAELGIETGRTQQELQRGAAVVEAADDATSEAMALLLNCELKTLWLFSNDNERRETASQRDGVKIIRPPAGTGMAGPHGGFEFVADVEPGYDGSGASAAELAIHCVVGLRPPPDATAVGDQDANSLLPAVLGTSQTTDFDIILMSDFRFPGGTSYSNVEEIKAQARSGFSTGLLQVESPVLKRERPLNPAIQSCLNAGMATLIRQPIPTTRCKLLVIRHPTVLMRPIEELPRVKADKVVVIVNQPPLDRKSGNVYFSIGECRRNARECFGSEGTWFPIGPLVRQEIQDDPELEGLSPQDWVNIIDTDEWRVPRIRFVSNRPVIGRHSRDSIDKWPDDAAKLLQAYPDDGSIQVRVLGGAEYARKVLGYLPEDWDVLEFGATSPREFLAGIDFFVYYHHPHWVEAFGRTILEALASGVPAILPPHFEELFQDAAIYSDPSGVRDIVKELYADRRKYEERSRRGIEFVERRFGYGAHASRLRAQMPRDKAPPTPTVEHSAAPVERPLAAVTGLQPSDFEHLDGKRIGSGELDPNSVYKVHIEVYGISDNARGQLWGQSADGRKILFEIPIAGAQPAFGGYFFTDAGPEQVDVMLAMEGADAKRARAGKIKFRRRADRPPQGRLGLHDTSVTAALATYPGRRHIVPDVIDSLVSQVDKLFIYMNNYEETPNFIKRHPLRDRIAYIIDPASERRGAAKFCWLDTITGYHLICDDDILYPPDYASRLVEAIERHQRKAILGVHGIVYARDIDDARSSRRDVFKFFEGLERETPVHFVGTGTTALHSSVLTSMDLSLFQAYPIANDEILAVSAKNAGVPMYCVARDESWLRQHSEVKFGICEERAMDGGEHDIATRLLASVNPWPDLRGAKSE